MKHILDGEFFFLDLSANTQSHKEIRELSRRRDGALFLGLCPQYAAGKTSQNYLYGFTFAACGYFLTKLLSCLHMFDRVRCVQLESSLYVQRLAECSLQNFCPAHPPWVWDTVAGRMRHSSGDCACVCVVPAYCQYEVPLDTHALCIVYFIFI